MTRSWMPETNTTPAGLAPEVSADATSTEPLLMPTSTAFWPCDAALATAAAASDGDVVSTVRRPAALKRASLRTRKSPGTMPAEPGISTATWAAEAGVMQASATRARGAIGRICGIASSFGRTSAPRPFEVRDLLERDLADVVARDRVPDAVRRNMVGDIHDAHDSPLRVMAEHMAAHRFDTMARAERRAGAGDGRLLAAALLEPGGQALEHGHFGPRTNSSNSRRATSTTINATMA